MTAKDIYWNPAALAVGDPVIERGPVIHAGSCINFVPVIAYTYPDDPQVSNQAGINVGPAPKKLHTPIGYGGADRA